jgi:nitric oxide dioxygenase
MFYDRLFEIAPQVKAMFPADMTEQRQKLMAMLAVVVNGLSNLESVLTVASALAKRHVTYGAKPEHYPVVGFALLWTLERGLGDAWTKEVADAWTAVYGTLSGYMFEQAYGLLPSKKSRFQRYIKEGALMSSCSTGGKINGH